MIVPFLRSRAASRTGRAAARIDIRLRKAEYRPDLNRTTASQKLQMRRRGRPRLRSLSSRIGAEFMTTAPRIHGHDGQALARSRRKGPRLHDHALRAQGKAMQPFGIIAPPAKEFGVRNHKDPGWIAPAAVLLALWLVGCEQQVAQEAPPPVAVSFLEVAATELPLSLEYAAQLRGIREVEVRARVSGILLERLYDEGEPVDAGDVLFKIDPAPFEAEVERARAELGVQLANLRAAERERDRIVPLYEQQLASLRDRDNAVTAYETARAAVAAAEAALRTAELALSY